MNTPHNYKPIDKLAHYIAFYTYDAQISLANIEDIIFAKQLAYINADNPVFVAALPRAGTTILLELLEHTYEFCSHTYRDMPLVLTPILWSMVSRPFRKNDIPKERAHGDGMLITSENPESFEEILWESFWAERYRKNCIELWDRDLRNELFEEFFLLHMKKIIFLRHKARPSAQRYLSKNNMNISRLEYLTRVFPKAKILLAYRNPLQHAASLLRQHLNFSDLHKKDLFAKRYMRAIGHFDFGENLKPINFNHWQQQPGGPLPTTIHFWLQYWIEAYSSILRSLSPSIMLFSYDEFCRDPHASLEILAHSLDLHDKSSLTRQSTRVLAARPHSPNAESVPAATLAAANNLYAELNHYSINHTSILTNASINFRRNP